MHIMYSGYIVLPEFPQSDDPGATLLVPILMIQEQSRANHIFLDQSILSHLPKATWTQLPFHHRFFAPTLPFVLTDPPNAQHFLIMPPTVQQASQCVPNVKKRHVETNPLMTNTGLIITVPNQPPAFQPLSPPYLSVSNSKSCKRLPTMIRQLQNQWSVPVSAGKNREPCAEEMVVLAMMM